jgi:hypothetical protein
MRNELGQIVKKSIPGNYDAPRSLPQRVMHSPLEIVANPCWPIFAQSNVRCFPGLVLLPP